MPFALTERAAQRKSEDEKLANGDNVYSLDECLGMRQIDDQLSFVKSLPVQNPQ